MIPQNWRQSHGKLGRARTAYFFSQIAFEKSFDIAQHPMRQRQTASAFARTCPFEPSTYRTKGTISTAWVDDPTVEIPAVWSVKRGGRRRTNILGHGRVGKISAKNLAGEFCHNIFRDVPGQWSA